MTNNGVTTESGGRQNMFPSETRPYIDESASYDGYPQNAEKVIRDSNAEIIFFNKYGEMLKKLKFENLDFIHSLVIDKKFMNDIEDYGTFYIFHNTNSKFNSILRIRKTKQKLLH